MELDEMKQAWQMLEQRLDRQQRLQERIYRRGEFDSMRHGLRPLYLGQGLQIAFGIAAMLWGISFWSTHLGAWWVMACGIAMQVAGIVTIAFAGRLLFLLRGIDYAAPVLEIQRRLASMRAWRVRVEAPVFVLLGSFMWIPAVLMLMLDDADRVGLDLWKRLPDLPMWLALNGMFALGLALLVYRLLRRAGRTRWLEDNFAGSAIRRAERVLDEIGRFERE